jgi:glycosyltransferase involved in cell wall biosynthesis
MQERSEAGSSVSVVMPLYNAQSTIERCLAPLLEMLARGEIFELIVVDDGSTDRSVELVGAHSQVQLLRSAQRGGPGAARNIGATQARGKYLWFVDSDVVLAPDAARVLGTLLSGEQPQAVIGSYDDAPGAHNFLSQYKNLVHAYYHHRGRRRASTFWSGCGAVRRDLFVRLGGFDAKRYPYPSIEDIELGYRIIGAHGAIVLEPALQGKHLKEWRLVNLLHTEVFRRAIPWSLLMLERGQLTDDLNVGRGERVRALIAGMLLLAIVAGAIGLISPLSSAGALALALVANRDLLRFLWARRGAWFACRALAYHQFYYLYSGASFAAAKVQHCWHRLRVKRYL